MRNPDRTKKTSTPTQPPPRKPRWKATTSRDGDAPDAVERRPVPMFGHDPPDSVSFAGTCLPRYRRAARSPGFSPLGAGAPAMRSGTRRSVVGALCTASPRRGAPEVAAVTGGRGRRRGGCGRGSPAGRWRWRGPTRRRPPMPPVDVVGSPPACSTSTPVTAIHTNEATGQAPRGQVEQEEAGADGQEVVAGEPHLGHEPGGQTGGGEPDERDRGQQPGARPPPGPQRHHEGHHDGAVPGDHEFGRLRQVGHADHGAGGELHHAGGIDGAQRVPRPRGVDRREGDHAARHHGQGGEDDPAPRPATSGAAASTATSGNSANCLHMRADAEERTGGDPSSSQGLGQAHGAQPHTHQVLGMKRLHHAVAGGGDRGEHDHEERLGQPVAGPRHPQEPETARGQDDPRQDAEHAPGTGTTCGWPVAPACTTGGKGASPGAHARRTIPALR